MKPYSYKLLFDRGKSPCDWGEQNKRAYDLQIEDEQHLPFLYRENPPHKRYIYNNINPLYGFLEKRLGQEWNNVYSEIVASLNGAGKHLKWAFLKEVNSAVKADIHIRNDGMICYYYLGRLYPIRKDFFVYPKPIEGGLLYYAKKEMNIYEIWNGRYDITLTDKEVTNGYSE